jgi:hypothetical protein
MAEERGNSIATAVGLGAAASMLLAQNADAATQVAELAGGDNRVGTIALLFLPALGWVGFNMLTPLQNQVNRARCHMSMVYPFQQLPYHYYFVIPSIRSLKRWPRRGATALPLPSV